MHRPQIDAEIGARVRSARESLGLRQADVASSMGVHQSLIARRERGETIWSVADLISTASVLGVPPTALAPDAFGGPAPGVILSPVERAVVAALRRGDALEAVRLSMEIAAPRR